MKSSNRRSAFTLVELLTVMAIIAILISILTPSLSAARNKARTTAVLAQLNAMSVGLEQFRGDQGEYPASNAGFYTTDPDNDLNTLAEQMTRWEVGAPDSPYQGAHLLVDALVGRDFLGYDPKAPISDTDPYNRWAATNNRRAPYIATDGVDVTSENEPAEDAFGPVMPLDSAQPKDPDDLLVRVFRDKFGWPILYYRANPIANQNTPIIQTDANPNDFISDGVYDGLDNEVFTSPPAIPLGDGHKIADANLDTFPATGSYGNTLEDENAFAEFIRSFRATTYDTTIPTEILTPRPVRSDTFILLSAGIDGIYGTLDDVANFQVLSQDR